jgi:hypothetical protein
MRQGGLAAMVKNTYSVGRPQTTPLISGIEQRNLGIPGLQCMYFGIGYVMDERESVEIASLMSIGFLADRLLLALDLYPPDHLAAKEPELTQDLLSFLSTVKELAERPVALLSRGPSTLFALPAGDYAGLELVVLGADQEKRDSLLRHLSKLEGTVETIRQGKAPSPSAIETLRVFLLRLAQVSLEQVDDRRMKGEAGTERPALVEWRKTSKS